MVTGLMKTSRNRACTRFPYVESCPRSRPVPCIGRHIRECYIMLMNLLVVLIVLMLLFGGGGFYLGGPMVGGSGFGLILLVLLVLLFTGRLSRR